MISKYPRNKTVYVDIDGTLLIRGNINRELIEWCVDAKEKGFDIVLWSARGREYAVAVAERLDITSLFCAILGKPGYIVDDMGVDWIRYASICRSVPHGVE